MTNSICSPALIYVIYMSIQVIIDIFQGFYNRSLVKILLLFVFGAMLNILCESGYTIVAWILVFVPFILLSFTVIAILFLLNKKETTGSIETEQDENENKAPVIVMPNNYSIQPTKNGCIMIIKHDLSTHGMREVTRDIYCPTNKKNEK